MDSPYVHGFPRNSFDAAAFQPAVRSYPIQPIELAIPNDPLINNVGLYNPSLFVDPALIHNAYPMGGTYVSQHGIGAVHPSALHYGNVMPGQMLGGQVIMDSPVSRPNSIGDQSAYGVARTPAFSRRTEGAASNFGPSRTSNVVANVGTEPYFCRTPHSSLRQRTAQACDKCRDRKTKCSGERPICKRCSDRGMICNFAPETRVRGHSRSKASGHIPIADLLSEAVEDVSPSLPASSSSEQLVNNGVPDASPSTGQSGGSRHKRGSLSRSMAKRNLAAQRRSWPMAPPPSNLIGGGMLPQTSIQFPVASLGSVDDDSWDSVWTRREPQVDAAPVPGRPFNYESLVSASFDYGNGSGSSRDSSPPTTASTSTSNLSTLSSSIDSLDGLSAMLQSQLPAAEDADFSVEMYDLLNLPASISSSSISSSSSSSGASPASGLFEGENLMDFADAAKALGGDIADEVTPVPQIALGQDDNYMSEFLSSDFYGLMN